MEHGSIEREIHIEASPEVVFEVITSPEHIREWWNGCETDLAPAVGTEAEIAWGKGTPEPHIDQVAVVSAEPPRLFAFRWMYEASPEPGPANSLLVTFELTPSDGGTLLRMTETGFREKGWEIAVMEAAYADHVNGWDVFIPSIRDYVARLAPAA